MILKGPRNVSEKALDCTTRHLRHKAGPGLHAVMASCFALAISDFLMLPPYNPYNSFLARTLLPRSHPAACWVSTFDVSLKKLSLAGLGSSQSAGQKFKQNKNALTDLNWFDNI